MHREYFLDPSRVDFLNYVCRLVLIFWETSNHCPIKVHLMENRSLGRACTQCQLQQLLRRRSLNSYSGHLPRTTTTESVNDRHKAFSKTTCRLGACYLPASMRYEGTLPKQQPTCMIPVKTESQSILHLKLQARSSTGQGGSTSTRCKFC